MSGEGVPIELEPQQPADLSAQHPMRLADKDIGYGVLGVFMGGVGGHIAQDVLDSANVQTRDQLSGTLDTLTSTLHKDETAYTQAQAAAPNDPANPEVGRLGQAVLQDHIAVTAVQSRLNSVPDHTNEFVGGGASVGLAVVLVWAAVKAVRARRQLWARADFVVGIGD